MDENAIVLQSVSLVDQIAALKKATADRLVELAKNKESAITRHKANLKAIDDEVAALTPKQKRKPRTKKVVAE